MKCVMCENPKELKKEKITHRYEECGLDNVTVVGIDRHHCDRCGEEYLQYGSPAALHRAIADMLLKKSESLTGKEVCFLRKHLGYSGKMFADLIQYDRSTVSRIENGDQPVVPSFDRLVRFFIASKLPDRDYDLHDMLEKNSGISFSRMEFKVARNGVWKGKAAA